jgi:lycopene beta-cyclase
MKEFDYIIIGGGCAGLSLAYELEINEKLKDKTLAIIEPRLEYKRDKTWSFWKVVPHNFDDCVKKSWQNFSINIPGKTNHLECKDYPYQSIDSGLFYEKISKKLKENENIHFYKDLNEINTRNSFIFNSVPNIKKNHLNLWQHFCGVEIETKTNYFDDEIFNLMDFDCEQRDSVHFFYTLPYTKNKALIETTWLSKMNDNSQKDYDKQIKDYIDKHLKVKDYEITYREEGVIPLFYPLYEKDKNRINIGTAGGMTRLSTGYTFLNIQEHSKYIRENIENISNSKRFKISKKYQFLDDIFLRVLNKHPEKMSNIFFNMFKTSPKTVIKFLSNKSNFFEDIKIILKMPKWIFIKALFY